MDAALQKEEEFNIHLEIQWQDTEDLNKKLQDDFGNQYLAQAVR